jgi:hypothetical protein
MAMDPALEQCYIDVTLMYVVDPAPSSGVDPGNVVFYYEYPPGVRSAPFGPTSVVTQMIQQEFRGSYGGRITITGVTLESGSAGGRFPAAATSATIGVYGEVVDNAGNGATTGPYYYTLTVSCEQAP